MTFRRTGLLFVFILSMGLALVGGKSSEERADEYYKSGMELLEVGDIDRALVEFRNVFKLNGRHKDARLTYARIQRERGQASEAYAQYLRLVEQYPDNLEGRRALGEMAIERLDWPEAERHARAARDLAPDDPSVISMNAALDYRDALQREDDKAVAAAVETARKVLVANAADIIARRLVIDQLLRQSDWTGALAEINVALDEDGTNLALHELKLRTLAMLQDQPGLGAHLQKMVGLFPDNQVVRDALISWYIGTGDMKGVENFLRSLTGNDDPEVAEQAKVGIVQFLLRTQGPDAARPELDRLIAAGQNPDLYRSMRAAINFDAGDTTGAIAEMDAIVKDAPPSKQTHNIRIALAAILDTTGNHVGARAQIERVLAEDPTHVAALRMQAARLIGEDRPGEAITVLRTALDQDPRDPETLTLMAQAHLRDGSRELAGERLALAADVSNQRAAESLRYASFLVEDGRLATAGSVLIASLRGDPDNPDLLAALADIYIRQSDWPRTEGVIRQLQQIGTDRTRDAANRIRIAQLLVQRKTDESIALLQQIVDQGDASTEATAAILRAHLQNGEPDRAASYLDSLLARDPDNAALRFLRAGLYAATAEPDKAEPIYRDLIAKDPANPTPVGALYTLLLEADRTQDAGAVLDAGIETTGRAPELVFIKAGQRETQGDFNGAIALYEELYALDSDNVVVANNLASLITTHLDDPEGLERAFAIAHRLRSSDLPPFQDTYGWIEYRRGNFEEALVYLEPAAKGLPDDPFVQLHLGLTYAALKRIDDARSTLTRAIEIAGDKADLPQFTAARTVLDGLGTGN